MSAADMIVVTGIFWGVLLPLLMLLAFIVAAAWFDGTAPRDRPFPKPSIDDIIRDTRVPSPKCCGCCRCNKPGGE